MAVSLPFASLANVDKGEVDFCADLSLIYYDDVKKVGLLAVWGVLLMLSATSFTSY